MPLDSDTITVISNYCKRDIPDDIGWYRNQFNFIDDDELRNRLGRAYYAARYISKIMEALHVSGDEMHPFVKFQIIQYASIYETVIVNLLWGRFKNHQEVLELQTHKAYKKVSALAKLTQLQYNGEELFTCVYKDSKTPRNSIPFHEKVDCAIRIGFVDKTYADDIKKTYELRNLAHIETEANKMIEVEIEQSKLGYWRVKPFLEKIADFIKDK